MPERDSCEKHWLDELADKVAEFLSHREKDVYVFNGGLSVSGVQHIGRLRGEILIPEAIRRILEKRGFRIRQLITVYTQDPWKGKKAQREQFPDPDEAKKYTGWPLIKVPDPKGCHKNWVDHYWSDFGPYLKEFTDGMIEPVTTTSLYQGPLRTLILREILPRREIIRRIINKYRGRKPYPEGWIPVEPICAQCGRIDTTTALEVSDDGRVRYRCKNCGYEGWADLSDAKLNWRLEWASIWKVLGVDFEPFGKDHATPGGSRDSCVDLAVNALGFDPPMGEWYEWVSIRVGGRSMDMTSSGFIGITPREWLDIAHPEILRFLYFQTHPHRKIVVDLERIPQYYDQFYRAERIYFGVEEADRCEAEYLKRTYELSHPKEPPERMPVQVPYMHASILAQIVGPQNVEEAINRLRKTGHVKGEPDPYSFERIKTLLVKAYNWTIRYAPQGARFEILAEHPGREVVEALRFKSVFCRLADLLRGLEEWDEERIKQAMIEATEELGRKERREFYKEFYQVFVGKPMGPRAAPLLSLLKKDFVIERLEYACGR